MKSKSLVMIVAIISLFVTGYANPSVWEHNGIPVRQGSSIEWTRAATALGNGTVLYVWSDTRLGDRDLWAQAVDENGVVWNEGKSVLIDGKPDRQEDPVVIKTSDGHAIIAWIDFHYQTEDGTVMAQKISYDGELMWEESVNICMAQNVQISLNIVPNNEGGAFIIWHDLRSGSSTEIYGMHLNADGLPYSEEWIADGLPLAAGRGNQYFHTFWEDGHNGAILAHLNEVDGRRDLLVKRIAPDGTILWERDLAAGEIDYASARIQPFGEDAFGFAYTDRRDGYYKIYVNVIDIDGEDVWEEALPVDAQAHEEPFQFNQTNPRVVFAADSTFIVVWEDDRMGFGRDINVQKFDYEGNRLWGERGLPVVINEMDQINPRIESDGDGGCLIVWEDGREGGHPNIDIYMQHFNEDGERSWDENGRAVAKIQGEAFSPLAKFTDDKLYIAWGDMRNGSVGIYYQAYDMQGDELLTENGIPVYWGLSGDAHDHRVVKNGDYAYIIWQDTRYANFGSQVKVQKIDSDGNILFAENGISVTEHSGSSQRSGRHQDAISAVPHHSGGIALAWLEQRGDNELAYVQAIDVDGNKLWGDLGLRVTSEDNLYTQDNPTISRDGESYIIVWDETDPGEFWTYERDIKAQKIVDGNKLWGDEGVHIAWQDGTQVDHYISTVIDGKYIVWRRGEGANAVIYAKMIDEDGNAVEGWGDYGTVICDYPGYVQSGIRALNTSGGLLILWEDQRAREGQPRDASIYGQLITEEGESQWRENGQAIADYVNDQTMISAQYEDGFVYIGWRDARVQLGAQDIAFQKIDLEGNLIWGEPAPYVIRSNKEHDTPSLVKVGDTILIAWENNYGELGSDLHMQLAWALNGDIFWDDEGEILCSTIKRQIRPRTIPFGENHAFVLWQDGRSSGKEEILGLYAQKVNMFTELNVKDELLTPNDIMITNYPNPFNPETTISFSLPSDEIISLSIYNIRGQLVKSLVKSELLDKGVHRLKWNGTDSNNNKVGSGVYFYRLESDNYLETKKMLLLK